MTKLLRSKELAIVLIVIMVLGMMIIPLPHILMDTIIAFNIGITIIVLMVVIYMNSTLSLTSFPSILLILTLIRIGVTVSTSRLILMEGNAGKIINTFGKFVVGGNLVIGIIIFIIITIINFIVITKGSERVAEVSARFTLDAMPGKQMSIDADLRSNNLTNAEAKEQRNILTMESKFFGAMDGAMKFVKGDAIASIIVIFVNLIGGITVGMLQHEMTLNAALQQYTTLTVGDGLVQQIPALIIALTSGLLITRIDDGAVSKNLGQTIINQVFQNYHALFASSILLALLGMIPGMPVNVFVILFLITSVIAFYLYRKADKNDNLPTVKDSNEQGVVEENVKQGDNLDKSDNGSLRHLTPLILCVSSSIKGSSRIEQMKAILNNLQQEIILDLGITVPQIIIRYSEVLEDNQYQILVHEIPAATGTIYWEHILVVNNNIATLSVLDDSNSFPNTMYFGYKNMGHWYARSNQELCERFLISFHSVDTILMLHLKHTLKKYLPEFIGIQEVKKILDSMTEYQDLIRELQRSMPLNKIAEVIQRLVREDISIRNFKIILDNLLEYSQREKEVIIINEYIRQGLGRYIAYKFSAGSYVLNSIFLSTNLENSIREAIRYNANGSYLALDPMIIQEVIEMIRDIEKSMDEIRELVIVTSFDIRRYVKLIIEKQFRYLNVLSFQELDEYAEFNVVGVVEINNHLTASDIDDFATA